MDKEYTIYKVCLELLDEKIKMIDKTKIFFNSMLVYQIIVLILAFTNIYFNSAEVRSFILGSNIAIIFILIIINISRRK